MEPLDIEEVQQNEPNNNGKTFGIIGVVAYILAVMTEIYSLIWGSLTSYHILYGSNGAPDAVGLSSAIRIVLLGSIVILILGLIGLVFQSIAFGKGYKPMWVWRVLLLSGLIILVSGIYPPNVLTLIISAATLFHVFTKRKFYVLVDHDLEDEN